MSVAGLELAMIRGPAAKPAIAPAGTPSPPATTRTPPTPPIPRCEQSRASSNTPTAAAIRLEPAAIAPARSLSCHRVTDVALVLTRPLYVLQDGSTIMLRGRDPHDGD